MKLSDILFAIKIKLFGDPERIQFMKKLMNLCESDPETEKKLHEIIGIQEDKTQYLEDLFQYNRGKGDMKLKIEHDYSALGDMTKEKSSDALPVVDHM